MLTTTSTIALIHLPPPNNVGKTGVPSAAHICRRPLHHKCQFQSVPNAQNVSVFCFAFRGSRILILTILTFDYVHLESRALLVLLLIKLMDSKNRFTLAIEDQYILRVDPDMEYHETCLRVG